jgi:hypothetical protein
MHRISRGGDEIEFLVESPRLFVFRVDGEGANAGNLRGLERALHGIFQEGLPDALTVPAAIYGKTREQHDRDGVTRQPFGETFRRLFTGHLADRERVVADDGIAHQADIGLCSTGLLVLPCVTLEITVQFLLAAVESFNPVIGAELFNAAISLIRPGIKKSGLFQKALQAGKRTGRGVERFRESFTLRGVETEGPPVRQRLIGARECAFQHEFADRAMGSRSRSLQRALCILRQAQVELFAACGACGHSFLLIVTLTTLPDNVKTTDANLFRGKKCIRCIRDLEIRVQSYFLIRMTAKGRSVKIIAFIRQAAIGDALIPHETRVDFVIRHRQALRLRFPRESDCRRRGNSQKI